jgi:Flp pilus assembly protein TadD
MSVRSKTKRRVIILAASAVVAVALLGGGYVFRKAQIRKDYMGSRERGIAAFNAGNYGTAVGELGRYIGRYGTDADARYYFGEAVKRSDPGDGRNYMAAIFNLRQFVGARPERKDVWLELATLNSQVGRNTESIEAAGHVLEGGKSDIEALRARARAYAGLREFKAALADAEKCAELDPNDVGTQVRIFQLYRELSQKDKILQRAQKYFADFSGDANSELLMSVAYSLMDEFTPEQREAAWKLALRVDPDKKLIETLGRSISAENYNPAAASILFVRKAAQRPVADAQHPVDDAKRRDAETQRVALMVHQLDRYGFVTESTAVMEKADALKDDPQVRHALVRRLWEFNQDQKVVDRLAGVKCEPTTPASVELMALRAISLGRLGKAAEASAIAKQLAAVQTDPVAQAWAAIIQGSSASEGHDPLKVAQAIRVALDAHRNDGYLRYFSGEIYAGLGEQDLAIDAFRQSVAANSLWFMPHLRLSRLLLETGQKQSALQEAGVTYRLLSNVATAANLTLIYAANLPPDTLTKDPVLLTRVEEIQKTAPGEAQTLPLYVRLLASSGKEAEAKQLITKVLNEKTPHGLGSLLALAQASREAKLGLEDACYAAAENAYGMSPELAYQKARDLRAHGKTEEAAKFFKTERAAAKDSSQTAWRVAWARFLDESADKAAGAEWLALADDPALKTDLGVQRAALDARSVQGDVAFKDRTIDRIKALTGENAAGWRIKRATEILRDRKGDFAQATKLLNEVVKNAFTDVEARRLLAVSMARTGNLPGAIEQMSTAITLQPDSVPMMLELAGLYKSQGDLQRAGELADRILQNRLDTADKLRVAELLLNLGNVARASAVVEGLPEQDLGSGAGIFLADLAQARNQPQQAAARYEQLLKKPDYLTVVAAASFYASTGRKAEVEKTLALLDKLELQPGWKDLALATHESRFGKPDVALLHFRAAVRAQPANAAARAGEIRLLLLLGKTDDALVAIDNAAKAVPDNETFQLLQKKAGLIKRIPAQGGLIPLVLSVFDDSADAETALEAAQVILDGSVGKQPALEVAAKVRPLADRAPRLAQLQILLARTYMTLHKKAEASAILVRTSRAIPNSPELSDMAAHVLAETGDWGQALAMARHWRDLTAARPIAADVFIADALLRLNDLPAATKQLQPYLDAARAKPDEMSPILAAQVSIWLKQGKPDQIAQLLGPLLASSTKARLIWIDVAQRLDRKEAMDWLSRVTPLVPDNAAEERVSLSASLYQVGVRFDDLVSKTTARKIIEAVAAKEDKNPMVLYSLAVTNEQDGRLEAADAGYRKVLGLDPGNFMAQNNLAMLIGRRGGDLKEALALASRAAAAQPDVATFQDTLAFVQLQMKDYRGAVASLKEAVRLEPSNIQWRVSLACAHQASGDNATATQLLNQIETLVPSNGQLPEGVRERLDDLRAKLGRNSRTKPTTAPAAAGL